MPMVITDPQQTDNPIVMVNQAFLDLTGYEAGEVIGRNCRFLQGLGTDPNKVAALRHDLAAGLDHVEAELLNYRKDGSSFWNQLLISPVTNEAGKLIYHFASQQDVTEVRRVKQLEAAERLLLMEIDHRAINALALVKSIVRLSRAETVAEFSASLQGRIEALARAHRLLAEAGWTGSDFGELVAGEIPETATSRVSASGSPIQLPAAFVQPLVLVLHELMFNAIRHGALSGPDGQVVGRWAREAGRLQVDWREDGVTGLCCVPELGFGLRTLVSLVEQQLGGGVTLLWPDKGFEARLELPLDDRSRNSAAGTLAG
jgi:PAS domain S-box-containing protein